MSLNQSTSSSSISSSSISPFDINCLPALDDIVLIGSPRFDAGASYNNNNSNNLGGGSYGFDGMRHQLNHRPAVCPKKISSRPVVLVSNIGSKDESTKRPRPAIGDAKSTHQTLPLIKKPKSEPRSSSAAPFQMRKEKLGDRIAAIQQLVAPFGKTDTASVLMEAIGYIKFLQTQVQGQIMEDGNTAVAKSRDLRSRGLCLVPLSCLQYVVTDHAGCEAIWPT